MESDGDAGWLDAVRRRLLAWYGEEKRDLPCAIDRDPYRILVSEVMLVQTTVTAVVPYFERFLCLPRLRGAGEGRGRRGGQGVGGVGVLPPGQAAHAAARQVVESHGGVMPDDPAAVLALPGVGRYMAGAILSQAFDLPEPILEANSQRVLARLLAWDGDLSRRDAGPALGGRRPPRPAAARRRVQPGADGAGGAGLHPRAPRCLVCPVASHCEAKRLGIQDALPKVGPRPAPLAVSEACAVVVCRGKVLVVRRESPGLWAGFWEFPTIHREGVDPAGRSFGETVDLAEGVRRLTGIQVRSGGLIKTLTYSVTKHRVVLEAYAATADAGDPTPGPGFSEARWVEPLDLADLTFSSAGRRLASAVAKNPAAWGME